MINQHIRIPYDEIATFCERHHIRKLSLFGSVLRDDFRPDSDVDVLVEFEHGAGVTYLDMAQMESDLSTMLARKVDLREPEELSGYFRQRVVDGAQLIYERE
ncbi:MAG: nucleotidyltransferase domain-containing protein [Anaerolineae bacterium]|nr:nucleotidyltransferase domain-containing protein [Anaerolineae bacterium]